MVQKAFKTTATFWENEDHLTEWPTSSITVAVYVFPFDSLSHVDERLMQEKGIFVVRDVHWTCLTCKIRQFRLKWMRLFWQFFFLLVRFVPNSEVRNMLQSGNCHRSWNKQYPVVIMKKNQINLQQSSRPVIKLVLCIWPIRLCCGHCKQVFRQTSCLLLWISTMTQKLESHDYKASTTIHMTNARSSLSLGTGWEW